MGICKYDRTVSIYRKEAIKILTLWQISVLTSFRALSENTQPHVRR